MIENIILANRRFDGSLKLSQIKHLVDAAKCIGISDLHKVKNWQKFVLWLNKSINCN